MELQQAGIILFTERYAECVHFYHNVCGLPVLFAHGSLTCLQFGGAYLMVEAGGKGASGEKSRSQNPTVLRFNVADVEDAANRVRQHGVAITVERYDWGTIAVFSDPDGNRCELKDAWS